MTKRVIGGAKGIPAIELDIDVTKSQVFIDSVHSMVHRGLHFDAGFIVTLALSEVYYTKIVTGDSYVHMLGGVDGTSEIDVLFLEDPTGGMTGGTLLENINSNRISSNTSGLAITHGVTAPTDEGTILYNRSAGGLKQSGDVRRSKEFVLKLNSTYLLKSVSSANANKVVTEFDWYEP